MTDHWCGPCLNDRHEKCVGLGCTCEETPRCAVNARLTEAREGTSAG